MNTILQKAGPELYQPILLPTALLELQNDLAMAKDNAEYKKAAQAVIKEFCSLFDEEYIRADMQLLLHGSFCNPNLRFLGDAAERHNIFLFYEFTLVMMDALHVLFGNKEAK